MAVDQYAECPCGSGKKLKFCCSDLVHEIEKVHRMLEGDQPRAALAHLEATLAKAPGRASLLDLKASIELSLDDADGAKKTIDEYRRVDPQNPSAHAQAALLAAGLDRSDADDAPLGPDSPARQAVGHLQDALELVTDSIPTRVLQAIGATGQALLAAGSLMAARAHLWLYQGVAGDADTRAMELLMRLNQVGGLPLLLRDTQFLREAPIGHPVEAQHDHAQLLASRGQWRRAAELLDKLCEEHVDLAILHHNAALVHGWLGDQQRLVAGLRKYAELASADGLNDDAVEAEAIAQLLDSEKRENSVEVVRTTYKVSDEESLIDRLTRDKRVSVHRLSESDLQALDGPPPRHTMLVLDKPLPESGVGISEADSPRIAGVLSYFGRQTDREERLELVADRDEQFDTTLALVADIAGDSLGDSSDEAVGQSAAGDLGLRSRYRFPDDTPIADRRRVMAEEQRRVLLEEWPEKPLNKLDGKTPTEAADDPMKKLALTAALLVLEQTAGGRADPSVFETLRQRLKLDPVATIDPNQADMETLPMARVARVDLKSASDDALFTLYKRTELSGATEAALAVAREAVHREGLAEDLPPAELYGRLAALEPDISDALGWIEQARNDPAACGDSNAHWDLAELELRVMEGQFDEANQLVHHLRDEHLNEPGIAERLYQLLSALGAVPSPEQAAAMQTADGPIDPAMPAEPAPASGGESKLWTPGDDAPAGGSKKIWTPG